MRLPRLLLALGLLSHCALAQSDTNANTGDVSLRTAHLPASVRHDIVAAIAKDFADEPKEFPSGRTIALGSWVSFVQLSRTGPKAILVQGGPQDPDNGATGNADMWLFRRSGDHAVLILRGGGYSFGPAEGRRTYHNGMIDVQTAWNMSCCSGDVEVYRYNGTRYRPAYCHSYEIDDDGSMKSGPRVPCSN